MEVRDSRIVGPLAASIPASAGRAMDVASLEQSMGRRALFEELSSLGAADDARASPVCVPWPHDASTRLFSVELIKNLFTQTCTSRLRANS